MDSDSDSVKKKVERWSPASNGRGCLPRRSSVSPGVWRILGLWLRDCPVRFVKENTAGSYEVVRPDVDPSDQIFLRDIFPIEKFVKVDRRRAGQVKVPYTARRWFRFLATGHSEIITCPVGILEDPLGAYDGLR